LSTLEAVAIEPSPAAAKQIAMHPTSIEISRTIDRDVVALLKA
jgi:hypothetical protein